MVYIKNGVDNKFMVTHEKANERCQLRGSMKDDELGDIGHFVPMRKKVY
jgi:hypothetical protein